MCTDVIVFFIALVLGLSVRACVGACSHVSDCETCVPACEFVALGFLSAYASLSAIVTVFVFGVVCVIGCLVMYVSA